MRKAFTIVELLVVMALIALMAGSGAAISLSAGRKKAVDRAAEDLATAMRQARDFAQAGKKDCSVCKGYDGICNNFDVVPLKGWQVVVDGSGYTVQGMCGGTTFGNPKKNFLNGVTATAGTGTVLFNPLSLGTNLGSDLTITLSASGTTPKSVKVTKNGEVSVP